MEDPPLGLYVHFPWCIRKCPYCDFNSHQVRDGLPADAYLSALAGDLEHDLPLLRGRRVSSVYFGGGTPSLFSAAQIGALLSAFRSRVDFDPDAEITLEANPGTVERDSFSAYAEAGINRVSLGAQSFDDECLLGIGRIHDGEAVDKALSSIRAAGFENFNIDLMYGLPGQATEQALDDLERAAGSGAAHISHYQLTIEPNTAFSADPPTLPGEEDCWRIQDAATALLESHGYRQYEISAWSRDGRECRHNLNYWRYGDFAGIGAGAHGKLTDSGRGVIRRLARHRHPRRYLQGDPVAENHEISDAEKVFEFFLNRLRLREAFTPGDFASRTGLDWQTVKERVDLAVQRGLLEVCAGAFAHTATGWRFVNDIQAMFLPPREG